VRCEKGGTDPKEEGAILGRLVLADSLAQKAVKVKKVKA